MDWETKEGLVSGKKEGDKAGATLCNVTHRSLCHQSSAEDCPETYFHSSAIFSWQVICLTILLSSHFIFGYHAELGHALTYLNYDFRQLISPSWGLHAMYTNEEYWRTTEDLLWGVRCICVYSWVYEYAHLCRWRPEVHTRISSSIAFQPQFLVQGLSLTLEFLLWLDWLASEPLRSTCLHDPFKAGVSYKQYTCLLRGCWRSELKSSWGFNPLHHVPRLQDHFHHFSKFVLCISLTNFIKMFWSLCAAGGI